MSQTLGDRDGGVSIQTFRRGLTHCDAPAAFAVRFVEAWEPLTAHKARVGNKVPSTVKHRPVREETETHLGKLDSATGNVSPETTRPHL